MAVRKRVIKAVIILTTALIFLSNILAYAVETATLYVEHVSIEMPEITVRFQLDAGYFSITPVTADDLSATLGGKPLIVENVEAYDEGTLYLFLADVSGSILPNQNEAMKQTLINFRAAMQPDDRMALVAFGDDVTVLLHGTESDPEAEERIRSLTRTDRTTHFYDAISTARSIADNKVAGMPERCVVIAMSDGLDDTEGGGHTSKEIAEQLRLSGLPLWALGLSGNGTSATQKDALDAFGELARNSGGGYSTVTADTLETELTAFYNYLQGVQVVHLLGENNIVDRSEQILELNVNYNNAVVTSRIPVTPVSWIPDNDPPSVIETPEQTGEYTIKVTFSELLSGADIKDNYIVTDSEGTAIPLLYVVYDPITNTGEITFDGQPYSGDYALRFSGITDISMEQNQLTGEFVFSFNGKQKITETPETPEPPEPPETPEIQEIQKTPLHVIFVDYWWVVLFVALVAAAVIIWLVIYNTLKKRRGLVKVDGKISFGDAVEFKHHFETPDSKRASLVVTDMAGNARRIDLDIYGSFFVGRSEKQNNLSFDDEKLSRQHFVIEAGDDGFFITDLNSTNGTHLNGVAISNKRRLRDNDVITAGHEKFVFSGLE